MRAKYRYRPHVCNSTIARSLDLRIDWRTHGYIGISTNDPGVADRWAHTARAAGLVVFDADHIRRKANEQQKRSVKKRRLDRDEGRQWAADAMKRRAEYRAQYRADARLRVEAQAQETDDDPLSP